MRLKAANPQAPDTMVRGFLYPYCGTCLDGIFLVACMPRCDRGRKKKHLRHVKKSFSALFILTKTKTESI